MQKITLLIYHKEYQDFLEKVRSVGTFHIIKKHSGELPDELHNSVQKDKRYKDVLESMRTIISNENLDKNSYPKAEVKADEIVDAYYEKNRLIQDKKQEISNVEKDIASISVWGSFDWQTLQKLESKGYKVCFYNSSTKDFNNEEFSKNENLIVLKEENNMVYFVVIQDIEKPNDIPLDQAKLPERSLSELNRAKEELTKELSDLEKNLKTFCLDSFNVLQAQQIDVANNINFDKAKLNGESKAEGSVLLLEGWVPDEDKDEMIRFLDSTGAYYKMERAEKEDNAPIKLKNNFINRMYEAITKMYGMPEYSEFDPTPLIAPFFTLFFGLCMGDAGYGLILIALGFILKKKMSKSLSGMFNLLITLGIATTFVGALLGTFFGFELFKLDFLPESYRNMIVTGKFKGTSFDSAMVLAIAVGVIHIIVAMFVRAVGTTMRYSLKSSISEWAWLILILGGVIVGSLYIVDFINKDTSYAMLMIIGGISAIGIYLLNNLKRNPLINIAFGILDTYNVATGLLGDVLSYIRLYALGLAGSMLGAVFNKLGFMIYDSVDGGVLGWVLCGLILVLGHTLNIAMSCISAFVHPLRLVFVEYFKNSNYSGRGEEYSPFKEIEKQ